jgi:MarR family transcriptional regulator for hemolysin
MDLDVLSTPGHLISLAARGFARLSEARLKPLGFGVGHLPVLVALQDGRTSTQRDLARFAKIEQPPTAQMLARMERDGLIQRAPDPADGRSRRITLTAVAETRLPDAVAALLRGNREVLRDLPKQQSSGGRSRLLGISKRGDWPSPETSGAVSRPLDQKLGAAQKHVASPGPGPTPRDSHKSAGAGVPSSSQYQRKTRRSLTRRAQLSGPI